MLHAAFISIALLVPTALPQDGQDTEEKNRAAREELIRSEVRSEYQSLITQQIKLQLRQMQAFLELDAKAVRRLEIASKGAAKKVVEKYGDKIADRAVQHVDSPTLSINGRMIEFPRTTDDEENPTPPARAAVRLILSVRSTSVSFNCKTDNSSTGYGMAGGYEHAFRESIWSDNLAAVVTREQIDAFTKHLEEKRRRNAVALMLAVLRLDLQLEESQIPPTREWLEQQIKAVSQNDIQSGARWAVSRVGRKLKSDGAEEFLSKEQVTVLNAKLADWDQ